MPLNTSSDNFVPPEVTMDSELINWNRLTGTAVTSTAVVTNLNADLLDGKHSSQFVGRMEAGTSNLPVGWYTVAVNSGSRAIGRFVVINLASDGHQAVVFEASHHYGVGNNITVYHNSAYMNTPISKLRFKYGGTYDGVMLQIYIGRTPNWLTIVLSSNEQVSGWVLKEWIPDGLNPGELTNFSACNKTTAEVNLSLAGSGNFIGVFEPDGNWSAIRHDGIMHCSNRIFSGRPGVGGIWVDGGGKQFFGSLDATTLGVYNSSWDWRFQEGGTLSLSSPVRNQILWNSAGVGAPTSSTTSNGTKLVLSPKVGTNSVDYAFGIETNALWASVPDSTTQFKWYAGTSGVMALSGDGQLSVVGRIGVGVASPDSQLTINAGSNAIRSLRVIGETGAAHTNFESYCASNIGVTLEILKATGSLALPGNTGDNASLGELRFAGYDANPSPGKRYAATVQGSVDGAVTTSAIPGKIELRTANRSGMMVTAVTVRSNGAVNFTPLVSAPLTAIKGDIYFDGILNKLRCYDGTTWQNCW